MHLTAAAASADSRYRQTVELFIGFMYAAALDIVLTHYYLTHSYSSKHAEAPVTLGCLGFVLFLGSDWSSKARASHVVDPLENYPGGRYLWKIFFELTMVFIIIDAGIKLFAHSSIESCAFLLGLFAFFSAAWDYLLLYTLRLRIVDLAKEYWLGNADQSSYAAEYTPRFTERAKRSRASVARKEAQIAARVEVLQKDQTSTRTTLDLLRLQFERQLVRLRGSLLGAMRALVAHMIVSHLLFANLAIGIILVLASQCGLRATRLDWPTWYIYATAIAVASGVCFIINARRLAARMLLVSTLMIYIMLPTTALCIVLICQQVVATVFFHLATGGRTEKPRIAIE